MISFEFVSSMDFRFAMHDVSLLLKMHDAERRAPHGRPERRLEVFKRAGVILAVTAWESFVEDTPRSAARRRIQAAQSPTDVEKTFISVAHSWLDSKPKPPDFEKWTGERWKALIEKRLETELKQLNTPDSEKVRNLSIRFLGLDITQSWKWQRTTPKKAAGRLDDLIRLRGDLVHRGPEVFKSARVQRWHAEDALSLLTKLVECTERALGVSPIKHAATPGQL